MWIDGIILPQRLTSDGIAKDKSSAYRKMTAQMGLIASLCLFGFEALVYDNDDNPKIDTTVKTKMTIHKTLVENWLKLVDGYRFEKFGQETIALYTSSSVTKSYRRFPDWDIYIQGFLFQFHFLGVNSNFLRLSCNSIIFFCQ